MEQLFWMVVGIVFLWLGALTYFFRKTSSHYQNLVKGASSKSLQEILEKLFDNLHVEKESIESLKKKLDTLSDDVTYHIQKVGILRYNPFSDTGGDQSFVLAILDGTGSGIVLTSLHSRGMTRWYAKNIKKGQGVDYDLSEEEKKAIKQAQNIQKKQ